MTNDTELQEIIDNIAENNDKVIAACRAYDSKCGTVHEIVDEVLNAVGFLALQQKVRTLRTALDSVIMFDMKFKNDHIETAHLAQEALAATENKEGK